MATKEDLAKYEEFFNAADSDRNGSLTLSELGKAMKKLGANDKIIAEIFCEFDIDGDKKISKAEYLQAMDKMSRCQVDEMKLRKTFKEFDLDGSGKISASELEKILSKIGKKVDKSVVDKIIKQVDKDGDGQINCEEFIAAFMKK